MFNKFKYMPVPVKQKILKKSTDWGGVANVTATHKLWLKRSLKQIASGSFLYTFYPCKYIPLPCMRQGFPLNFTEIILLFFF